MLPDEVRSNVLSLHKEAKNWRTVLDELAKGPNFRKTQSKTSIYKLPDLLSVPPAVAAEAEKISRWILGYFRLVWNAFMACRQFVADLSACDV